MSRCASSSWSQVDFPLPFVSSVRILLLRGWNHSTAWLCSIWWDSSFRAQGSFIAANEHSAVWASKHNCTWTYSWRRTWTSSSIGGELATCCAWAFARPSSSCSTDAAFFFCIHFFCKAGLVWVSWEQYGKKNNFLEPEKLFFLQSHACMNFIRLVRKKTLFWSLKNCFFCKAELLWVSSEQCRKNNF